MKTGIRQFTAVGANSFAVLVSDNFLLILHILLLSVNLLIACLPGFAFGQHIQLVTDESLAFLMLSGIFATAIATGKLIAEDLRKGTLSLMLSRPVPFHILIYGKYAGVIAAWGMVHFSATVSFLWVSRIIHFEHHLESLGFWSFLGTITAVLLCASVMHFKRGGAFAKFANVGLFIAFPAVFLLLNFFGWNFDPEHGYGELVHWPSAGAFILMFGAVLAFAGILTAFSTVFDSTALICIAFILFFAGLFSDSLIDMVFPAGSPAASATRLIVPGWQLYWGTEMLTEKGSVPIPYILSMLFHGTAQAVIYLAAGSWIFSRKKDIAGAI